MGNGSSDRVAAALRSWLTTAPPGARVPSSRALVAEHRVGPGTVQQALRDLARQGLVETRPGVGTFARAVRTARPADHGWQTAALGAARSRAGGLPTALRTAPNDVVALHSGYPDRELLPERLVRAALTRAARGDTALSRPPSAGLPELQAWFAAELGAATAVGTTPPSARDVVVLPGTQSGLATLFRALVGDGEPLLVESPTYWGALTAAASAGVRVVPVPTGPTGPDPADVERALAGTGARVFYAQPTYANPTGAQWSAERAAQVLDVVRAHGAFLVEDDWAHDFGITTEPRPLAAQDDAGHVVHLRSLTKSVSPALRVGAVVARGPARDRILADRSAESVYVSGLLQAAALDVVTQPSWQRHLRGVREQLRGRRDLLVRSLREHAPRASVDAVPPGGLNLWVRLPEGTDVDRVVSDCERSGVLVGAGTEWFPAEPAGAYLRLNYSGPDPSGFDRGARVLGEVLEAV